MCLAGFIVFWVQKDENYENIWQEERMETMKYNKLGLTDLNVSEICLGTMTFGEKIKAEEAEKSVQYAFDRGVNFIDTAEIGRASCRERV